MSKHTSDMHAQTSFFDYAYAEGMTRSQRGTLIRKALRKELRSWLSHSRKRLANRVTECVTHSKHSAKTHVKRIIYRFVNPSNVTPSHFSRKY